MVPNLLFLILTHILGEKLLKKNLLVKLSVILNVYWLVLIYVLKSERFTKKFSILILPIKVVDGVIVRDHICSPFDYSKVNGKRITRQILLKGLKGKEHTVYIDLVVSLSICYKLMVYRYLLLMKLHIKLVFLLLVEE